MAPGATMTQGQVTDRLMVVSVRECPRGPEVGRAQLERLATSLGVPHDRPDGRPQPLGWLTRACAEAIRRGMRLDSLHRMGRVR